MTRFWGLTSISAVLLLELSAFGQFETADYFHLLGIAQKTVRERKISQIFSGSAAERAGESRLLATGRRPLVAGETWQVAFTAADDSMARMTDLPQAHDVAARPASLFTFLVRGIDSNGQVRVEIKQAAQVPVDPRVASVALILDGAYTVRRKEIIYGDGRAPLVVWSASGLSSGFEGYPIELPDLSALAEAVREVPPEIRDQDLKNAVEFNFTDLYARPIRAIWREREPWPLYVRSPKGVAVLVHTSGHGGGNE